jgi:F-type H+-transporting ATPase subunit a
LSENFPDSAFVGFLHQWENVIFSSIAAFLIGFLFLRAASRKSVVPHGIQNFCEAVVEGLDHFVCGILGKRGTRHVPFLGTVFLYILLMNWSGVVPLMKSPTAAWSTTLAVALCTMIYVQMTGIREQGLGHYLKHMAGNPQQCLRLYPDSADAHY